MNLVEDKTLSSLRSPHAYYSGRIIICWEIPIYKKVVFLIAPARKKWGYYYYYDTIWCKCGGKCGYMWGNDI